MVRVRERTAEAVCDALSRGLSYGSTGPEIQEISLQRVDEESDNQVVMEATVRSSEARRVMVVTDNHGVEYWEQGDTFETATFRLPSDRWARFEVIGPDGSKAWSNPFDLTQIARS